MALVSLFAFNLFCAMFQCSYKFPEPEVSNVLSEADGLRNKRFLKNGNTHPVVEAAYGKVQGFSMTVMSGRKIFAFEGIKYAMVHKQFKPAIPIKRWKSVRKAFKPGPKCIQLNPSRLMSVIGHSDCLFLNVYTPGLPLAGNLDSPNFPVVVFIHGGSFVFGSGDEFGPSYLLKDDVVLVTLNYRLGPLGFLSTGDEAAPGNYGLKDQLLAIQWVRDNIAYFGGDVNKMTLMGQSAGAVSAHLQLLKNTTSEIFSSGVLLSGTAFQFWSVQSQQEALDLTKRFAKVLNCPTHNNLALMTCLEAINPNMIVGAQFRSFRWIPFPAIMFRPVIENPGNGSFLEDLPENIYKSGLVNNIPLIFGRTSQEGQFSNYFLNIFGKLWILRRKPHQYLPIVLDYERFLGRTDPYTSKIMEYYFKGKSPMDSSTMIFGDMVTGRYFSFGIYKAMQYHLRYASSNTYGYVFSYFGKYNVGRTSFGMPEAELGVSHTDDLFYVLNVTSYIDGLRQQDPEWELSKIMTNILTNFASDGIPSFENEDGNKMFMWEPSTLNSMKFLEFNREIHMIGDDLKENVNFWSSLSIPDMKVFQS